MKAFEDMEFHPKSEEVVKILCERTQNNNPLFFRVQVGYYWAMIAAMMRVTIDTADRGEIPVNMYALNLSTSGSGKGFSTNVLENEVTHKFRKRFVEETFPEYADIQLPKLAVKRAARKSSDPDDELRKVMKEYEGTGALMSSFDSATPAAVKQQRHKLLMVGAGSLNLQIDEIGANFAGNIDALTTFLELYDVGAIKQKLIKNTAENVRNEEIHGRTPTNMLLFGTPSKLLNGGKVEEELYSMLETGYARRCFFGYSRASNKVTDLTPEQVYDLLTSKSSNATLKDLADKLEMLADTINLNRKLTISKPVSLLLIEYKIACEKIAALLPEHEEMRKAEISHRYFKVLKLAGAYAFVDDCYEVTEDHIYNAIKLAEESGEAFNQLLTRDRPYVKLAKYIATCKRDVTQADLVEDLPFYRGTSSQKAEMLQLATAYGHHNNIVIKKSYVDGIEFLRGESLEETDLNKMIISWSQDVAQDYANEFAPFDKLDKLTQVNGLHWSAHHLNGGHRNEENAIPGFNLVVVDVDGGADLEEVRAFMKGYKYHLYTTKRHTDTENRFRLVLPLNYVLKLDAKEYKEFMHNIYDWLPFTVDTSTSQRARKWLSNDGISEFNDGVLLDALPFIPKTSKNEERKAILKSQESMDNMERWILNNSGDGNRNNMLLRYAMILIDAGASLDQVQNRVMTLNSKMPDKLDETEVLSTIMLTAAKAFHKRA